MRMRVVAINTICVEKRLLYISANAGHKSSRNSRPRRAAAVAVLRCRPGHCRIRSYSLPPRCTRKTIDHMRFDHIMLATRHIVHTELLTRCGAPANCAQYISISTGIIGGGQMYIDRAARRIRPPPARNYSCLMQCPSLTMRRQGTHTHTIREHSLLCKYVLAILSKQKS